MCLEEMKRIDDCNNEKELVKLAEEINDKIIFKYYNEKQMEHLVNKLLKLDFLSVKYETREEILNVLCDAVSNYNISSKIDWTNILKIVDKLENDLKEYVTEFLHD